MKTWKNFKKEAKKSKIAKVGIEIIETIAAIISAIIDKRIQLGISQRELAAICGLPQSFVLRIESCAVKPNVETLLIIMKPLGLTLSVASI